MRQFPGSRPPGVRYYRVRLFLRDAVARTAQPIDVAIDDRLPFTVGGRLGAFTYDFRNRTDAAAWPALYEKAFAKLSRTFSADWFKDLGDYDIIGSGSSYQAMTVLTGLPATAFSLSFNSATRGAVNRLVTDQLDFVLRDLADSRRLAQVNFMPFANFQYVTDSQGLSFYRPGYCRATRMAVWADGMNLTANSGTTLVLGSTDGRLYPLITDHAYAVVGSDPDSYFLFNPWGFNGRIPAALFAADEADATPLAAAPAAGPATAPATAPAAAGRTAQASAVAPSLAFGGVQTPEASPTLGAGDHGHRPIVSDVILRLPRRDTERLLASVWIGQAPDVQAASD